MSEARAPSDADVRVEMHARQVAGGFRAPREARRLDARLRPGGARGFIACAEIDVRARRTDDGAAGILRDHQPAEPGVGLFAHDRQQRLTKTGMP